MNVNATPIDLTILAEFMGCSNLDVGCSNLDVGCSNLDIPYKLGQILQTVDFTMFIKVFNVILGCSNLDIPYKF